jgi:aryl-alcohol dehydrogenase-like predicted oxidoreductase
MAASKTPSSVAPSFLHSTRRKFVQYGTMAGVGAHSLLQSGDVKAALFDGKEAAGLNDPWPEMEYTQLGKTGHNSSRLVFGCGATLSGDAHDDLLDAALDAGVNTYDVGYKHYYGNAEKNMRKFLQKNGDKIFLISKGAVPVELRVDESISMAQAKQAAAGWIGFMEESLREMQIEHVDAYYYMGQNNVSVITNEELHRAFEDAKAKGKVSHLGVSTHENAKNVLDAAAKTGWYSLAMTAITPGGWYDWEDRAVLPDSPPMKDIKPFLSQVRDSGIGLVGMKAGRFLAGRRWLGWGDPEAFDKYYDEKLLQANLTGFQRSYAYVLQHGVDVVNADMQTLQHLKENFVAAATSKTYFDLA